MVAQSVEQKTENLRVGGSIPPQGTTFCWCGSMAEQLICNQQVDGSTPFTSSNQKSKELSFRNRGRRSGRSPAPSAPFLQNPARPGDDPIRESGSPFQPVPRGAGRGGFKPLDRCVPEAQRFPVRSFRIRFFKFPALSGSYEGRFPSGQRGQTVNLLSSTSMVRIHLSPPRKPYREFFAVRFFALYHFGFLFYSGPVSILLRTRSQIHFSFLFSARKGLTAIALSAEALSRSRQVFFFCARKNLFCPQNRSRARSGPPPSLKNFAREQKSSVRSGSHVQAFGRTYKISL